MSECTVNKRPFHIKWSLNCYVECDLLIFIGDKFIYSIIDVFKQMPS